MKKRDIILIIAIIAAGAIAAALIFLTSKSGRTVEVKVSGSVVKTFDLSVDTVYEIEGAGGGRNLLVISGGKAMVTEASCPDKLCMNMGEISKAGQSIVCLPNEVVVEITGEGSADDGDIIVN